MVLYLFLYVTILCYVCYGLHYTGVLLWLYGLSKLPLLLGVR